MSSHLVDLAMHTWPSREHFVEAVFRERAFPHSFVIHTDPPESGVFTVVCRGGGDVITFGCAEGDFASERELHDWVLLALDDVVGEMEQADWGAA
jgi:hypothetical protein